MSGHLKAVPLSLKEANEYVAEHHRHHKPVVRDKYRLGAGLDGKLVGVVNVGNPVARMLCDGETLEVTRLCTDGTKNACSFLYNRAAKIAFALGYKRIITYILEDEPGTSLEAAGWRFDCIAGGAHGTDRIGAEKTTLRPAKRSVMLRRCGREGRVDRR